MAPCYAVPKVAIERDQATSHDATGAPTHADSFDSSAHHPAHFPATSKRTPRFLGVPISAAKRVTGRRPARAEASARPVIEPVLCIEEAIRRYAEAQPAQLYRGGA